MMDARTFPRFDVKRKLLFPPAGGFVSGVLVEDPTIVFIALLYLCQELLLYSLLIDDARERTVSDPMLSPRRQRTVEDNPCQQFMSRCL